MIVKREASFLGPSKSQLGSTAQILASGLGCLLGVVLLGCILRKIIVISVLSYRRSVGCWVDQSRVGA